MPRAERRYYRQLHRWFAAIAFALILQAVPLLTRTISAHAILAGSDPPANAILAESPAQIRLWFSEPLEPRFSGFELRDISGKVVASPSAQVTSADTHLIAMSPGKLADGLYTVSWHNISTADGHGVAGSFAFVIGGGELAPSVAIPTNVELAPFDTFARTLNFIGLALAVGSIVFVVMVWQPAMRAVIPALPKPLWIMIWLGWWLGGVAAMALLINQTAIVYRESPAAVLTTAKLGDLLGNTRFGTLWLARMTTWAFMGALLLTAKQSRLLLWLAAMLGLLMLLPTSLGSHAAANSDQTLSIFSDWVHLALASLWIGGLAQFLVAIAVLATDKGSMTPRFANMTAHFSNFARVAVVGLVLTGIFATWYQVNPLTTLFTSFYGRLLSMKFVLALFLLAIAAVNLLWTQRRLFAGKQVWVGRLRFLVGLELIMLVGVLIVVGALTAMSPARNIVGQLPMPAKVLPTPTPQRLDLEADDLKITFLVSSGWVGANTFTITLSDVDGEPITDATFLRLRFTNLSKNLGKSELLLRPKSETPNGVYILKGANLSTVGAWQVRMTIKRPHAYDSVVDLPLTITTPPAPVVSQSTPIDELMANPPYRTLILFDIGVVALLAGLYFLAQQRAHLRQGAWLLPALLVILGLTFLWTNFTS
jgi:copper transport protein